MPHLTKIQWTKYASNPIFAINKLNGKRGHFCTKESRACKFCYAERINLGRFGNGLRFTKAYEQHAEFQLNDGEVRKLARMRDAGPVFLCDMTDMFHPMVPDEFIDKIWAAMALSRATFQILTKHPDRMARYLLDEAQRLRVWEALPILAPPDEIMGKLSHGYFRGQSDEPWRLDNVWLGSTVEDRPTAATRLGWLMSAPAAVHFVSHEPMLESVDFSHVVPKGLEQTREHDPELFIDYLTGYVAGPDEWLPSKAKIDWLIAGGESGGAPARRLVERDTRGQWVPTTDALMDVLTLRDRCQRAGVPFFWKQWGGPTPSVGGRLIENREWNEMPKVWRDAA